ncbi:DUF6520 family protein [Chryseobacterium foetidum]|uniref:DUF6520 family protein n=1 Tax=Chryseobacterium foetidum TaxID=2951057 RepID=UPI0021C6598B|nr:DUF6520 family protein [Chryseobacterium foetidum]
MKKILFPVVLIVLGTGSAFATMMAKENKKAIVKGYRIVDVGGGQFECQNTLQDCSNIAIGAFCQWTADPNVELHNAGASETMCGDNLYELP